MKEILASLTIFGLSILSPLKAYVLKESRAVEENEVLARDREKEIDWEKARLPFSVTFTLAPGEAFAFHKDVLPEFKDKVVKTTGATFHSSEGFKTDGYLFGDGVCHLASLINWVASRAGFKVTAKVNHDFLLIPEIPREFGTAIFYLEGNISTNQLQNLYLENPFDFPVEFVFLANNQRIELVISRHRLSK